MANLNEESKISFSYLVEVIQQAHLELSVQASKAVNMNLTIRNWLIGYYIHEYELNGSDRAEYGSRLIEQLAESLRALPRTQKRELNRYRLFYKVYPQIGESVTPQLHDKKGFAKTIENRQSATAQSVVTSGKLLRDLSYTHFEQLFVIEDDLKRSFYEIESIRGNWSVRELKRQINSLYYERSGLSLNKKKLSELANEKAEQVAPTLNIRDPYVFEFLGLRSREVMSENDLEDILLDKLQDFLLELGHGFCFEARQKRILIGDEHFFVDLVFYHRILKCHILVELKINDFTHENIGQLNTYVSYYKKEMMASNDNPPIGILLCTQKNRSLVEYALAGMDNQLFVSKYQLELPSSEEIENFLQHEIREENI